MDRIENPIIKEPAEPLRVTYQDMIARNERRLDPKYLAMWKETERREKRKG